MHETYSKSCGVKMHASSPSNTYPQSSPPEEGQIRGTILGYWSAEGDSRASKFVRLSLDRPINLAVTFDLVRHYSWDETTHMVDYMIIDRVRPFRTSDDEDRHPRLENWQKVLDVCSSLGSLTVKPARLRDDDLVAINLKVDPSCQPCRVGPHIFTRNYMTRCLKLIEP